MGRVRYHDHQRLCNLDRYSSRLSEVSFQCAHGLTAASCGGVKSMSPAALVSHVLLLLSIAAPQAPAPRAPGDLFAELFERGLVKQKSMTSIRATFTETTVSTLLVKPIVARGTIIAAPPARVRMTYTEPEPKMIVMDAGKLTVLWTRPN